MILLNFTARKFFKIFKIIIVISITLYFVFTLFFHFFPLKYVDIIEKYSEKYKIEPSFVCAVINVESGFNENAISNKGASGLMQIMQPTAEWASESAGIENFNYDDILIPDININIGCWYLSWLLERCNGNYQLVLAAYNAGIGNVNKWLVNSEYSNDGVVLNTIPFEETDNYVQKVVFRQKIYSIILKLYNFIN